MRQALHILRKDIRGQWYEIAITMLVTAIFAFSGVRYGAVMFAAALLLPFTWWNLIARVIQSEALPGDRQFWLTRPYNRTSLLSAKALFVLLWVNLPMLLAQGVIVAADGAPFAAALPGLLWTQLLLTAAFILPVAAFSTLTAGLSQLLWAAIPVTILVVFSFGDPWLELAWVRTYYILTGVTAAALAIIAWQYVRRQTSAARLVAAAAVILISAGFVLIPWTTVFWLQSKFSRIRVDNSSVRVAVAEGWHFNDPNGEDKIWLILPVTFSDLPVGTFGSGWLDFDFSDDERNNLDRQRTAVDQRARQCSPSLDSLKG